MGERRRPGPRLASWFLWLLWLVACGFDSSGSGKPTASLGNATSSSGDDPLTSTSSASTATISEGTDGSTTASEPGGSSTSGVSTLDGGTADTGGPSAPLDDADVLVRYYLDEASEGQAPTRAHDATLPPLDLGHTWAEGMTYVDVGGNRGLHWEAEEAHGGPSNLVRDTKVREHLEGKTAATIEVVADIEAVAGGGGSRIFAIGHGNGDVRLGLLSEDPEVLWLRWRNNKNPASWNVDLPRVGRAVFHVVLDTTAAEDDRVRLYVDGVEQEVVKGDWPSDGETIDFHNDSELVLGNRRPNEGERSFRGSLYYAALYATAFSQNRIAHHVAVLTADDDAP